MSFIKYLRPRAKRGEMEETMKGMFKRNKPVIIVLVIGILALIVMFSVHYLENVRENSVYPNENNKIGQVETN